MKKTKKRKLRNMHKTCNSLKTFGKEATFGGAKTIVDEMRKKYLLWNDWSVTETKENEFGDILGAGAWGKIVAFNEKTVVKLPIQPLYCIGFEHEHNILQKIKKIKNPVINVLSTNLSVAAYGHDRLRGKVELVKQKYLSNTDLNTSCIFFMKRIHPPLLQNLFTLCNKEKQTDLEKYHSMVTKPYYIFLGRLCQWSVTGRGNRMYDIGTLSLTDLNGVAPDPVHPQSIIQTVLQTYSGSGCVVTNYTVMPNTFAYKVGREMCKYMWDVFIEKHIILYDTEFVYGTRVGDRSAKVFIIDCNLCREIDTTIGNNVKTAFVNNIAAAMEIRLPTVNPMFWGGFLPNPLITPNFAIECLQYMVDPQTTKFEVLLYHAQFIISLFSEINTLLSDPNTKGTISKYENDIKHVIFSDAHINFTVPTIAFRTLPENHDDAVGIEKQVKNINKQLAETHARFTYLYSRAYLLELALAASKNMYTALVTPDNISYISNIVSARVSHWLLNPDFVLDFTPLFLPLTREEMRFYKSEDASNTLDFKLSESESSRQIGKKYKPSALSPYSLFSEII